MSRRVMVPGDIVLSRATGLLGWLFRFFTLAPYMHAALYVGELGEVPIVADAGWRGVRLRPYRGQPEIWRVEVSPEEREAAVVFAVMQVGHGYDFFQLVGFVISWLTCGRWNPFNSRERYICSELINAAYGYRLGRRGVTSPGTLARSNMTRFIG